MSWTINTKLEETGIDWTSFGESREDHFGVKSFLSLSTLSLITKRKTGHFCQTEKYENMKN